jgi:alpha-L-rhamnosidase
MTSLAISSVFFEHHQCALGIAETKPRITWRFEGNVSNWEQSAYDIELLRESTSRGQTNIFSFNSSNSLYVPWPDEELGDGEAASIRVRAHGSGSKSTLWSDWVVVETGLLSKDSWAAAKPISADVCKSSNKASKRPIYFRREFEIPNAPIASARLYITGLGIYKAKINGQRVGDLELAPGWQSYHHRHVYDTYDVTDMVKVGRNAIGVVAGEGWYSGRLGSDGGTRDIYGDSIGILATLIIVLDNGTKVIIPTDAKWKASRGPIVSSEIYDGETYDARLQSQI